MSEPVKKECVPCRVKNSPLKEEEVKRQAERLESGWKLIGEERLEKAYLFKNFKEALGFVNDVGKVAEEEGHHPDIELSWGRVKVTLYTHAVKGLTEVDFSVAAKCDVCYLSRVN